jgi:hypothetical protein
MPIKLDQQAILTQGQFKTLHTSILGAAKVTVTGFSVAEFTTIPFRIKEGRDPGEPFEASEASIPRGLGLKRIQATAPEGVGTLEVRYELRTGADA